MTPGRSPRPLGWLGALLVLYLVYPLGAFVYRVVNGHNEGWNVPGLWSALRVSLEGATISVLIGVVTGIPLAYVLARRRGWLSSAVGVVVQLPLAVPPLISGILLIYIVGPYSFLGQRSGERLTQTMYGVVIAQSFVSLPFLVVVARSAFRGVDPSLGDVAATLGHGPLVRFLRVDVPAAADGLRTGMILMWLRAFGEYGTTVVLAYHPYSLPVYVDNLFSSAPLSQAEAPTILAFGVAVVAVVIGQSSLRRRRRPVVLPAGRAPAGHPPTAVAFDLDFHVGTFHLAVSHAGPGHRLAVVGPSGSGKSMTLRALAGLLGPGVGRVSYGGADVTRIEPERRRVGYVPQGYGLLPGRTVWQQVMFGVHADPALAAWWIETLHLAELVDRTPDQLSGGQRQRVSLARALATQPDVVLLDEPFSALDAPVRAELRRELRRLQQQTGLSTVFVTHDPEEAAILADELLVVSDGTVLQAGSTPAVFRRPATVAVGRLLGVANLHPGVVDPDGALRSGRVTLARGVDLEGGATPGSGAAGATAVLWRVPPSRVHIRADGPEGLPGEVVDVIDLGTTVEVTVGLDDGPELVARLDGPVGLLPGQRAWIILDTSDLAVWASP